MYAYRFLVTYLISLFLVYSDNAGCLNISDLNKLSHTGLNFIEINSKLFIIRADTTRDNWKIFTK